jgi:hypothetical protein
MGCASVLLTACFIWIIFDARPGTDVSFAYFLGAVFGLPALFFVLIGLPGSTFVRADSKGLEVRLFWLRAFALSWPEIEKFEFQTMLPASPLLPTPYSNVVRVVLTSRGKSRNRRTFFQRITRGRLGNERGIPDIFSVRAAELARLLNDMRNRYVHAG